MWHWYKMIRKRQFDENDMNKNGFGYCIMSDGTTYEGTNFDVNSKQLRTLER